MSVDSALYAAVEARAGEPVDEQWLEQGLAEAMAYVRLLAPCKRATWTDYAALPADVKAVLVRALTRMHLNPRGIRQETIGEYSYTLSSDSGEFYSGPFSPAEARIITSLSGCGGAARSITLELPPVLHLDAPETYRPIEVEP